ncbi:MAG: hypothetical protein KC449_06835 [Anaerolineales bacterium]|nr:hypothetical protein [Anaerolineales bacterium]
MSKWSQDKYGSRGVTERIFVRGLLHLDTPTHFGGGVEGTTDMPLLYDAQESRTPLLTGASLAGALRNYLREYEKGYRWEENQRAATKSWAECLFGHLDDQKSDQPSTERRQRSSVHSWLMVDDAFGQFPDAGDPTEFRSGVSIDPKTRTAQEGKLFDLELLSAGTIFPISFELWIDDQTDSDLLEAFAIALDGLEQGKIGLGLRKQRGYGQCHVTGWQVSRYKMTDAVQIIGWLTHDLANKPAYQAGIYTLLGVQPSLTPQGQAFGMQATFALNGSLFIRSYGNEKSEADAVHLQSWRAGEEKPILPGTSLAGALRARAQKIVNTMAATSERAESFVDGLFGRRMRSDGDTPSGSRLLIRETTVEQGISNLVQNRASIDRFTGGARDTALFNEQPLWGKPETRITVDLRLLNPTDAGIGLLLLLLKDLWTGDLPVGGESSVGRGRLQGKNATLSLGETVWKVVEENGRLQFSGNGSQEALQNTYLAAFLKEMGHGS